MDILRTIVVEGLEKRDITINLDAIVAIEKCRNLDETYLTLSTGRELIIQQNFEDLTLLLYNYNENEISHKIETKDRI